MSKRYNLSVPREYEVNGEKKTAWDNIGVMFERDKGGYSINLSMFPGLKVMAFPAEPKGDGAGHGKDEGPIPF